MFLSRWFKGLHHVKVTVILENREFTFSTADAAIDFFSDVSRSERSEISRMIRDRAPEIHGYKVRYT